MGTSIIIAVIVLKWNMLVYNAVLATMSYLSQYLEYLKVKYYVIFETRNESIGKRRADQGLVGFQSAISLTPPVITNLPKPMASGLLLVLVSIRVNCLMFL